MVIIKIFIIIIFIFLIIFLNKNNNFKKERFYQSNNEEIILKAKTPEYNTLNIENAKISLNPKYKYDNMNINVQNDILIEDNIKINNVIFDIDSFRYIKQLPIHFVKEICLSDKKTGAIECINKDHIDMIKGNIPLNVITYPDNQRKCLAATRKNYIGNWSDNPTPLSIFSAKNCKNGDLDTEFYIKRDNLSGNHEHDDYQTHYHIHDIDTEEHSLLGEAPPSESITFDGIPVDKLINPKEESSQSIIKRENAVPSLMTNDEFNELAGESGEFVLFEQEIRDEHNLANANAHSEL